VEGTLGHIGRFELQGTCLEMGCMCGVKSRVGAKCARKCGVNREKGFDEEERAEDTGDTLHDSGRDGVLLGDVGRNQGNGSGPWAGTSLGDHLHTREQRWRLFVRPSRKPKLNIKKVTRLDYKALYHKGERDRLDMEMYNETLRPIPHSRLKQLAAGNSQEIPIAEQTGESHPRPIVHNLTVF